MFIIRKRTLIVIAAKSLLGEVPIYKDILKLLMFHLKEKQKIHENIEIEEIVENNEFVTSSPSINSELEHPNEIFCSKRDKDLQPIVQVRKLTKAEIELFEGGKSLQPHVLFTKLKDIDLPQNSRKKVLDYILPVKKGKKANPKLH